MKLNLNSLPWQSLSVAVMGQLVMTSPAAAAPVAQAQIQTMDASAVSCINMDANGKPVVTKAKMASLEQSTKPRVERVAMLKVANAAAEAASSVVKASAGLAKAALVQGAASARDAQASWIPTYRGTGADRIKDAVRKRQVMRLGVLWNVDADAMGVDAKDAMDALMRAGAASARVDSEGQVYFRARHADRDRIAKRAATAIASRGGSGLAVAGRDGGDASRGIMTTRDANLAMLESLRGGSAQLQASIDDRTQELASVDLDDKAEPLVRNVEGSPLQAGADARNASPDQVQTARAEVSKTLGVEVAMLRVEGDASITPESFIDAMPSGLSVVPFGTSFAIHVPAAQAEAMWGAIDSEGKRVLLVGSSAPVASGVQASDSIRLCGGEAVLKRFPTPKVEKVGLNDAILDIENQKVATQAGDIMMVVKDAGLKGAVEVALLRFVRR